MKSKGLTADTIEGLQLLWKRFPDYGVLVCLYDKDTHMSCSVSNLAEKDDMIRFLRNEADRLEGVDPIYFGTSRDEAKGSA